MRINSVKDIRNMLISNGWTITYDEFHLDCSIPFSEQIDDLNEDLFQATKNNYIIDIGWYPEMNSEGKLIMNMIKDFNWSQPEKSYDVICYNELVERIEETIHS